MTVLGIALAVAPPANAGTEAAVAPPVSAGTEATYTDTIDWTQFFSIDYSPGNFSLNSGPGHLVFQTDGNLVFYENSIALWQAQTYGRGATKLALQTDGNIVVYAGNTPLWQSGGGVDSSGSLGNPMYAKFNEEYELRVTQPNVFSAPVAYASWYGYVQDHGVDVKTQYWNIP
jgi:hypothetical protein